MVSVQFVIDPIVFIKQRLGLKEEGPSTGFETEKFQPDAQQPHIEPADRPSPKRGDLACALATTENMSSHD